MPYASHFEDLQIWREAKELSLAIYRQFRDSRDYRFREQIQAAAVSVMNNIAEGFERRKGGKEFERFLCIAKGSVGEARPMLYLAKDLRYLPEQAAKEDAERCVRLSKGIYKLIASL